MSMNNKIISVILLVVVVVLSVFIYRLKFKTGSVQSLVDLDRPLVVGVVSWPGYVGGIVANGGF